MTIHELPPNSDWFTFIAHDLYQSPTKAFFVIEDGTKGFIKRNGHDPRYFQVILSVNKSVIGEYINGDKIEKVIGELKTLSDQSHPEQYWLAFWRSLPQGFKKDKD